MIQNILSLHWLDYLLFTFTDIDKLSKRLEKNNVFLPATLMVPVIAALFEVVTLSSITDQNIHFINTIIFGWLTFTIKNGINVLISSSLLSLAIGFTGNSPKPVIYVNVINLSYIPKLFVLPIISVFSAFQLISFAWYLIFSLVALWFSLSVIVRVVREIHEITISQSVLAVITPLLTLYFSSVILGLFSMFFLFFAMQ